MVSTDALRSVQQAECCQVGKKLLDAGRLHIAQLRLGGHPSLLEKKQIQHLFLVNRRNITSGHPPNRAR